MDTYIIYVVTNHYEKEVSRNNVITANDNNLEERLNIALDFAREKMDDFMNKEIIPYDHWTLTKCNNNWLSRYDTYKEFASAFWEYYSEALNMKMLSLINEFHIKETLSKEIIENEIKQIRSEEFVFWPWEELVFRAYFDVRFDVEVYVCKWDNEHLFDVSRNNDF